MKKGFVYGALCLLAALPLATSQAEVVRPVPETLQMTTRTMDLPDGTHEIHVWGSAMLYITQGDSNSIILEANPSVLEKTKVTQEENGIAVIKTEKRLIENIRFWAPKLTCTITLKNLSRLLTREGAQAKIYSFKADTLDLSVHDMGRVDLMLDANLLTAFIERTGQIFISGSADQQRVVLAGSGLYGARDFQTKECKIDLFRDGVAFVNATNMLTVNIFENGEVDYRGNPSTVVKNVSSTGRLIPH